MNRVKVKKSKGYVTPLHWTDPPKERALSTSTVRPSVLTHASTTVLEEEDAPSLISRWVFAPEQWHSLGWV